MCDILIIPGSGVIRDHDLCAVSMMTSANDVTGRICFGNSTSKITISNLKRDAEYQFIVNAFNRNSRRLYDVTNTLCSKSVMRRTRSGNVMNEVGFTLHFLL